MERFHLHKSSWLRLIPFVILILGLIAFFYFRLYRYLTFQSLQDHRAILIAWTQQHFIVYSLIFILIYIFAVAFSIPNAVFLTLIGGFIFGPWLGSIYVVISATIGACIIFLAVKLAFYSFFHRKAGKWLHRMETGFKQNAFSYLLFLRLVPLFPFWLINIVPALLGVRLKTFFISTLIGIIPGTVVYVLLGNGLGVILDQGKTPDLSIIFKPEIFIPIIGLAILSLIPVIYKRIKHHG